MSTFGEVQLVAATRMIGSARDLSLSNQEKHPKNARTFVWIQRGNARLRINGETRGLHPNTIVYLRADADYTLELGATTTAILVSVSQHALIRTPVSNLIFTPSKRNDQTLLNQQFEQLLVESHSNLDLSSDITLAQISLISLYIQRLRPDCDGAVQDASIQHAFGELVKQGATIASKPEDYANQLGVSQKELSRICKEQTGLTPAAFIKEFVLSRAQAMLLEGISDMSRISDTLGFGDSKKFSKNFKTRFGMSPLAYKDSASRPN